MNHLSRIEQQIPAVTALMVLTIAIGAFCLSFVNLRLQAIESGIPENLAFMWAVVIDALLVAGSLMILRSSLRGEKAVSGWNVLLVFTGASIFFNAIHAPDDIIARLAHIVPPIALCVSIELLMQCIRSDIKQRASTPAPAPVTCTIPHGNKRGRGSDAAHRIQEHYKSHPDMSTRERAEALGLHRSTINRHLNTGNTHGNT